MSVAAVLFLLFVAFASAIVKGVDVSTTVTSSAASCFVNSGYQFVVVRAYTCGGSVDNGAVASYRALRAAGMPHVGIYMFPCVGTWCPSASSQVATLASFLSSNNMQPDSIWLDVENGNICPWGSSASWRESLYSNLVSGLVSTFPSGTVGVYSSYWQWLATFSSSTFSAPGDANLRVWFSDYDSVSSLTTNWRAFGAWSAPYVKQYIGDATVCSTGVDINVANDWSWPTGGNVPYVPPAPTPAGACTDASGRAGSCIDTTACANSGGKSTSSASGANGCQAFANNIECCVGAGATAASTEAATTGKAAMGPPCAVGTFNSGQCIDGTICSSGGGFAVSSANGATGCGALASNILCCVGLGSVASSPTPPPCVYKGAIGACVATSACTAAKGQSRSSRVGATGCAALAANIQCCLPAAAMLQDGLTSSGGSGATSAPSVSLIAGVVVGAVVLVALVVGLLVFVVRRRGQATSSTIIVSNAAYKDNVDAANERKATFL